MISNQLLELGLSCGVVIVLLVFLALGFLVGGGGGRGVFRHIMTSRRKDWELLWVCDLLQTKICNFFVTPFSDLTRPGF